MEWNESTKKEKNILWKCEEKEGEGTNSYISRKKEKERKGEKLMKGEIMKNARYK